MNKDNEMKNFEDKNCARGAIKAKRADNHQSDVCDFLQIEPYTKEKLYEMLPWPSKDINKYSRGEAFIVAGCNKYPGAACLCAKAATKMGAGYVRVVCGDETQKIVQLFMPEAVVSTWKNEKRTQDNNNQSNNAAYILGPGFDAGDVECQTMTKLTIRAATEHKSALLIDGGALGVLSLGVGVELLNEYTSGGNFPVLTPHTGEAKRLAHSLNINTDKLDDKHLAAALSKTLSAIVCLKGPNTYIAIPSACNFRAECDAVCSKKDSRSKEDPCSNDQSTKEKTIVYPMCEGTSALAKAGSGDVLAGMIGGLLAQGKNPAHAAILGASIHAYAGCEAAKTLTDICTTPSDVIENIPSAIKNCNAQNNA